MPVNRSFGTELRLRRLSRHGDGRLLVVPLDHSVSDGPIMPAADVALLVRRLADSGVDAVVLHRGSVRGMAPLAFGNLALIVHLSASTQHAEDPDAKYLVASVEGAMRWGADAVSVHVNLGSRSEARQLADLAAVSERCERWGMPLLAMMYPRGPRIDNPHDPALVSHAATLAADLGADIVKVPWAGSVAAMSDVVRSCVIPVVVAGGPRREGWEETRAYASSVLEAGAAGLAMGRNIFQAVDPGSRARQLAALLHPAAAAAAPPARQLSRT
jgi:2-amino-4,5-dihydroxy-6-oxo-7-(phosphooxy)heptanoate synthase